MKVYTLDGTEKDLAWLQATWGVTINTSLNRIGGNFLITRIWEREGAAIYPVRVLNAQGLPWEGVVVGRYWPDAPNSWPGGSKPDNVVAPPGAETHAVFGITNSAGMVEFALGKGDYAGPGMGVTSIWIPSHFAGSDVICKLGMLPNTNHRTLGVEFQYFPGDSQPIEESPGCIPGLLKLIKELLGWT
jgi:hypothetical protein